MDLQYRVDDCACAGGHAPTVMGILRRVALNIVCTVQQNFRSDLSIVLSRSRIGLPCWHRSGPERDFSVALRMGPGSLSLVAGLTQRLEEGLEAAAFPHIACEEIRTVRLLDEVY